MTTYHNRRIDNPQPNDFLNQQIRIDHTKVRIPWRHRGRTHGVEQRRGIFADKLLNLCVGVCGAHAGNGIVRPGWRGGEASCDFDALPEGGDIERGREEAGVDEGCVEWVAGVYDDGAA